MPARCMVGGGRAVWEPGHLRRGNPASKWPGPGFKRKRGPAQLGSCLALPKLIFPTENSLPQLWDAPPPPSVPGGLCGRCALQLILPRESTTPSLVGLNPSADFESPFCGRKSQDPEHHETGLVQVRPSVPKEPNPQHPVVNSVRS